MVNQLYKDGDPRQPGAFGIFYMGINTGAFLGTFFVGLAGEKYGWHWGFTLAAIGMVAGLLTYIKFKAKYLAGIGMPRDGKGAAAPLFIGVGIVLSALVGIGFHFGALGQIDKFFSHEAVFYTLMGGGLLAAIVFTAMQAKGDKGPVASIFIFMLFNFLFWLAFEQAATSLNFFTDEKVDRHIGTYLVPTSWFQNINPFTIILFSPLFAMLWTWVARKNFPMPQPVKIGIGLIFLGLGYVFMVVAGQQVRQDGALAMMWLLFATYFLHTIGELFLSPTGLSYVSKAAPEKHKSMLMGVWFLSSFLAYTVGGKLAGESDAATIKDKRFFFQDWGIDFGGGHANFFFLFVFLAVGGGIVCILLTPLLRKLMRHPND
jgi:POT family proton-dependent oligopeptide transporter